MGCWRCGIDPRVYDQRRFRMTTSTEITPRIDAQAETERIVAELRATVRDRFNKRGAVLGISGGVDSSTVAYLCVRAFGAANVLGMLMPEQNSSSESARLAHAV